MNISALAELGSSATATTAVAPLLSGSVAQVSQDCALLHSSTCYMSLKQCAMALQQAAQHAPTAPAQHSAQQ